MAYDEVDRKPEPMPLFVAVLLSICGVAATALFTTFCIGMTVTIARSMLLGSPQ